MPVRHLNLSATSSPLKMTRKRGSSIQRDWADEDGGGLAQKS